MKCHLKTVMQRQGVSVNDMVRELNVTRRTVQEWRAGRQFPRNTALLDQLCHFLRCDIQELYEVEPLERSHA